MRCLVPGSLIWGIPAKGGDSIHENRNAVAIRSALTRRFVGRQLVHPLRRPGIQGRVLTP